MIKTKFHWLFAGVLAGILATAGCGGSGVTPAPPGLSVLTMYSSTADFGDVAVGNSRTLGMTFSNTGGSPLTVQQNSVSGAGFMASGIGAGVTLAPGQYVTLSVNFGPSVRGSASGSVLLASSTLSSPINLPLKGYGLDSILDPTHETDLTWDASTSVVVGYNIYRNSVSDATWTKVNFVPVTTNSYTDWSKSVSPSLDRTFYLFAVKAVSPSNVESAFSTVVSAATP